MSKSWGIQKTIGLKLLEFGDPDGNGDLQRHNLDHQRRGDDGDRRVFRAGNFHLAVEFFSALYDVLIHDASLRAV